MGIPHPKTVQAMIKEIEKEEEKTEKQKYAEAFGYELGEDDEWLCRCDNCFCWGASKRDITATMEIDGEVIELKPCRRGPPHVIWRYEHLIHTGEDFPVSRWPYTAGDWCCGGWVDKNAKAGNAVEEHLK